MPAHQFNAQDEAHLGLISVFHYVLAGLYLLGIGFVILHFMVMTMIFRMAETQSLKTPPAVVAVAPESPAPETTSGETIVFSPVTVAPVTPAVNPFPKEFIPFMIGIYSVIGLLLVILCIGNILSGLFIRKRKNRTFSFVIAGVNCLQIPFGTALGVFTFIVLSRISVKMEYDARLAG